MYILLAPGILDAPPPIWADALDLLEPRGVVLDDVKDFLAEFPDQAFGVKRPDAFDHPAAEIFLDALARRWRRAAEEAGAELAAKLAVLHPMAFGRKPLARVGGGH